MANRRWFILIIGVMVCAIAATGCKSKKKGAGAGGDDIGGISGTDADSAMGDRAYGEGITGLFSPVYFDYDSAQINQTERAKLDGVAEHLKKNSTQVLTVEGSCDERGSNEYNLALGERRALAVRAYLVGLGIDASRVQTKSYGEERPVSVGHDEASWSQNRRAEFVIVQ